jgi:hypothetical protein
LGHLSIQNPTSRKRDLQGADSIGNLAVLPSAPQMMEQNLARLGQTLSLAHLFSVGGIPIVTLRGQLTSHPFMRRLAAANEVDSSFSTAEGYVEAKPTSGWRNMLWRSTPTTHSRST